MERIREYSTNSDGPSTVASGEFTGRTHSDVLKAPGVFRDAPQDKR